MRGGTSLPSIPMPNLGMMSPTRAKRLLNGRGSSSQKAHGRSKRLGPVTRFQCARTGNLRTFFGLHQARSPASQDRALALGSPVQRGRAYHDFIIPPRACCRQSLLERAVTEEFIPAQKDRALSRPTGSVRPEFARVTCDRIVSGHVYSSPNIRGRSMNSPRKLTHPLAFGGAGLLLFEKGPCTPYEMAATL